MTNKYLEKIAERPKKDDRLAGAIAAGFGVGVGGDMIQRHAGKPIHKAMHDKPGVDWRTLKKIMKHNRNLNVTFSSTKAMHGMNQAKYNDIMRDASYIGPHYASEKNLKQYGAKSGKAYVHMGHYSAGDYSRRGRIRNLNVAIHELGHAKDKLGSNKYLSKLEHLGYASKRLHLGTIGGAAMLTNDKTKDKAWIAPLLAHASTLRSEAAANYHGMKMLARHGNTKMMKSFAGLAGKNMLGYGAKPITQAAALYGLGKMIKGKHDK